MGAEIIRWFSAALNSTSFSLVLDSWYSPRMLGEIFSLQANIFSPFFKV